jgi:anhydro-N-acetylmuramic acid kinase
VTHYIGLISGTSMDGIDAVLARIDEHCLDIVATATRDYPAALQTELLAAAADPAASSLVDFGRLHGLVAREFAAAVQELLATSDRQAASVRAIGSHGQTLLHAPGANPPFTLQAGDPGTLAVLTGIPVVADFRNADMALGGQGAPLVPAFHRYAFGSAAEDRALVNIGGIANLTLLPAKGPTTGFDTGPGNTLMDDWFRRHHPGRYDKAGAWASGGRIDARLLAACLADPYLAMPSPKSTGTDYYNGVWLDRMLASLPAEPAPQDVQATLAELTARTIADAFQSDAPATVAVCGGGAYNEDLIRRLQSHLPRTRVDTTANWGIEPAWVEAAAFAWLAAERLACRAGNVPSVTGASAAVPLGGVFLPPAAD